MDRTRRQLKRYGESLGMLWAISDIKAATKPKCRANWQHKKTQAGATKIEQRAHAILHLMPQPDAAAKSISGNYRPPPSRRPA